MKLAFSMIAVLSAALAVAALQSPAHAAGGEAAEESTSAATLEITFSLFAGGVPFGQASMTSRVENGAYKASALLETRGIVNRFWQSKIETASYGRISEGRLEPANYDSFSLRRNGRRQEVTVKFDTNGPVEMIANPEYDDLEPIDQDAKRRSLDPLSSVLFLLTSSAAGEQKPCAVTAPVFDGRRRYDIAFSYSRRTNVSMDNGLYKGSALVCEVEYRQVAGHLQRIVERGGKMPRIFGWIASVPSTIDPSRKYMIPLRLWSETEFGLITVVASQVKIDGKVLKAS